MATKKKSASQTKFEEQRKIKKFLHSCIKDMRVLVVDGSAPSRTGNARVLKQMGFNPYSVRLAASFDSAVEEIRNYRPSLIISEFNLGKKHGLELAEIQREYYPIRSDSIFFLITSDGRQQSVAQALDGDVDGYLLKPYTAEIFVKTVEKVVYRQANPPPYLACINRARDLIQEDRFEESVASLQKAVTLHPRPALACYYFAKGLETLDDPDGAEDWYKKGLGYNKIHYRCLLGLYELFLKQNKSAGAYEIVKRLSEHYPVSPQRLREILKLAIETKSVGDVERYYEIFKTLEDRDESLFKYVSVTFIVCGRYFLDKNKQEEGLKYLNRSALYSSGGAKLLRSIIEILIDHNLKNEAEVILKKFPVDTHSSVDYKIADYLISDKILPATKLVINGRALVEKGIVTPEIYEILIRRAKEISHDDYAEELLAYAQDRWPKKDWLI